MCPILSNNSKSCCNCEDVQWIYFFLPLLYNANRNFHGYTASPLMVTLLSEKANGSIIFTKKIINTEQRTWSGGSHVESKQLTWKMRVYLCVKAVQTLLALLWSCSRKWRLQNFMQKRPATLVIKCTWQWITMSENAGGSLAGKPDS